MLSGHFRPRIDDILSVNHAGFVNNQSFDLFLTDQYLTTDWHRTAFWLRRREAEGPDNNDKNFYFSILFDSIWREIMSYLAFLLSIWAILLTFWGIVSVFKRTCSRQWYGAEGETISIFLRILQGVGNREIWPPLTPSPLPGPPH